jgi:acyl-CoA synthetase (AMP-forming)/AMP-acid ligase II
MQWLKPARHLILLFAVRDVPVLSWRGGWFHTGDLMRERETRELRFISRKKDLIIRGGSNISPIEVARAMMAHPTVCDAAVIGIPDANLGRRVVGFVRLAENSGKSAMDDISPIRRRGLLTTRFSRS